MINCCQSLNGLEQIDADVVIVDNINVETELTSLQTQIDNLQVSINNGGGYFVLCFEFNGNSTNAGYFGCGAGVNSSALEVVLPNCTCFAYRAECTTAVAAAGSIVFQRNGTAVNNLGINYSTGETLKQDLARNTTFVLGDVCSIRFNNAGSAMGGTLWRVNYIFQTNAVNGQSVNFETPTFTSLQPNQTAFLTDTITTAANTQNHQLAFGIPRGKSISGSLGSVSSGTAAVSITTTTDGNGNDNIAFNFVLQSGANGSAGAKGDQGDKGDNGSADPITIAVATSAGAAAGGAAGGSAGTISGASAGASSGASSGASAATSTFNSLVDPRLQIVENKTYNMIVPTNVLNLQTIIGGTTIELYPTGTLYLGGQVFGTGNTTDNIFMECLSGININGSALTIDCPTTLNEDVVMDGANITIEGLTIINNNLDVNGDIELERFLTFNNGTVYDIATFDAVAIVSPSANNQGTMNLNSGNFNIYSLFNIYNERQEIDYPYLVFNTDAGFSGFSYASILCDTTSAPASNNGGNMEIVCNELAISNDLQVKGNLEVLGTFALEDLSLNNLTINTTLKTSLIRPLDANVVMDIGSDTTELNLISQVATITGETVSIGGNVDVNVVELAGDSLSIGENANCGIIDIGNPDITETMINGLDLGVNTDIINLGQNGTTTQITARADSIVIGDTTTHGKTTSIDTQIINIGINGGGLYPCDITIGSDTSTTDILGDLITLGDPNSNNAIQVVSDVCNILTNGTSLRTNALDMGSNYTTTANLTGQSITILGTASTTLRGDTINIGNDSSTDTIQIGNAISYTEIEGSQINMGVGSVLNTINIGNAFSVVNIQGNTNNPINVAGMFFNQIGF
jgi:hypothetical protein